MIARASDNDQSDPYEDLYHVNPRAKVIVGFEPAYLGYTVGYRLSAVYDYDIAIAILAADKQINDKEAEEFLNLEIISECKSQDSPLFLLPRRDS